MTTVLALVEVSDLWIDLQFHIERQHSHLYKNFDADKYSHGCLDPEAEDIFHPTHGSDVDQDEEQEGRPCSNDFLVDDETLLARIGTCANNCSLDDVFSNLIWFELLRHFVTLQMLQGRLENSEIERDSSWKPAKERDITGGLRTQDLYLLRRNLFSLRKLGRNVPQFAKALAVVDTSSFDRTQDFLSKLVREYEIFEPEVRDYCNREVIDAQLADAHKSIEMAEKSIQESERVRVCELLRNEN